jgi:hypothetical protein
VVAVFDTTGAFHNVSQVGAAGAATQGLGIDIIYSPGTRWGLGVITSPSYGIVTGFTSGSLGGTQYGSHGINDAILFRMNSSGIMP